MFDISPSIAAIGTLPLTASEIDSHPDAGRIWATIMQEREYRDEAIRDTHDEISQEISDLEDEKDAAQEKSDDILGSLNNMSLSLAHGDDGIPFAINHSLVPYNDTDEALVHILEEKFDELIQDIIINHFGEEEDD